jgi:hypothetical protein
MDILYLGIDPGATGGLGLVDHQGHPIAAHRWDKGNPANTYNILYRYREQIKRAYIEVVSIYPRSGMGHAVMGQSLLINAGIWRGWLIALNLTWAEIHPATWQSRHGLHHWQKKQKAGDANQHSPLTLARLLFPTAGLQYQADDGKAVGLLLADLARREQISSQVSPTIGAED